MLSPSDIHKVFEELHDLYTNGYILVTDRIFSDHAYFFLRHIRNGHKLTIYCKHGEYIVKRYGKEKKKVIW